jgi:hypothetical protein
MQRRTFDLLVSVGGVIIVIALVAAGFIFRANADFAQDNVRQQLEAQNISFKPAAALSPEERKQPGVVKYAGQKVTTGDQALVFANEYIALHMEESLGGKTYSELSTESRAKPDDQELKGKVETAFRGETLRGLLLTTYGFWTLGEKAEQASWAFFAGAAALLALSIVGFVHYARTPRKEVMFQAFTLKEKEKAQAPAKRTGANGEKRSTQTRR